MIVVIFLLENTGAGMKGFCIERRNSKLNCLVEIVDCAIEFAFAREDVAEI
jgi:hypothetical protein